MPARTSDDVPLAAPRFAPLWALLVYSLATIALGYSALGGGFLVSPISDQMIGGFPVREFAAASLKAGNGIPLWNPYIMGGLPYVAAMHGDIYYPTFLLRALLPTDVAMTWSFMLHYPLAGLFTFVFLRAWGVSFIPALLGGLAYLMCGPIASYVSPGHDGKLYVSTLLPLVLWALTRGVRDGRAWGWGVVVIAVGLAVLSPHPQLLQYFLLTAGAYALFVAFGTHGDVRLERGAALKRLGLAAGAVAIGMLMGAVQYWPVLEYVKWSPRAAGGDKTGWDHAVSYSFPPEELINFYLPEFTGGVGNYWGRNGIHFHSEYLGAALLVLAFAGIAAWRLGKVSRGFVWFWIGTAVVSLLWAIGGYTPFYRIVYALVPGTKFFRAPSTMIYVTAFAVCVLAALGTERLLARHLSPRYLLGWAGGALVVALLGAVGGLTGMAEGLAVGVGRDMAARSGQPQAWSQYVEQLLAPRIQENAGALAFGGWRAFVFVALVAGLGWLHLRRAIPRALVAWGLVFVIAADFFSVMKGFWQFSPPASQIYGSDPAIDAMRAEKQPARVLVYDPQRTSRDPLFRGDGLMVHEVRQVEGYHGNELGRFRGYLQAANGGLTPGAWSLYNVKFVLANQELAVPGLTKVVGPIQTAHSRSTGTDERAWLYRLPGSNPYAWVTPAVLKAPDDQVLATVADPRFDSTYQRRVALAAPDAPLQGAGDPNALPEPLDVRVNVDSYRAGRVTMRLDRPAPAAGALVVSENYYPGWTARVDGKPAPVGRVDYTLVGVGIPAGARAVELTFESGRSETGRLVTLLSLALALVVIVAGVAADRRQRAVVV